MIASVLLLAITSQISLEVAVIPFLWMLPLSLYLLSFVLCFEYERVYHRGVWVSLLLLGAGATAVIIRVGVDAPMLVQLAVYLLTMFFACMVCHGELVRHKPDPRHLTGFYLLVSAGGAAGGLFTGLVAPNLFPDLWELPLSLVAACALALVLAGRGALPRRPLLRNAFTALASPTCSPSPACSPTTPTTSSRTTSTSRAASSASCASTRTSARTTSCAPACATVASSTASSSPTPTSRPHAHQLLRPGSAVGLAIRNHPRRLRSEPLRLGFVGLGAGTLACYAAKADSVRFYEINPDVVALSSGDPALLHLPARRPGEVSVAIGDARINLEREPEQKFDVLALDAFSSDSIPAHLLTVEAVQLYLRHLRDPDSVLAVHISNRYLDLDPVVRGIAKLLDLTVLRIDDAESNDMVYSSDWMLLARDPAALAASELQVPAEPEPEQTGPWPLWTDAYSNLMQVFKG
jgi:hypothetical protein